MRNLIFISHRIPYPLTKGEKIRGYNLITHLAKSYHVHLGCLIDDPADWQHIAHLRTICAEVAGFGIDRRRQKLKALARMRPGRPLMPDYYFHPGLLRWVNATLAREHMDIIYIYSAAMAPYALHLDRPGKVLDMQDIDSEKWALYSRRSRWPMRAVWAREARTLLVYERCAAMACDATFFVTEAEARRFAELAPETADRLTWIEMGVDLVQFSPGLAFVSPYDGPGPHLVFTGNMDYWPNADAVTWFADQVMPMLGRSRPGVQFHIVGNNPGQDVLRLKQLAGVHVTGRVPDVRPYVAHATVSVSPLRMARGVQNKVLEAMAMGTPVVASPQAFEGLRAAAGRDLLVADGASAMARAVTEVIEGHHPGLGRAGRQAVERGYAWSAILEKLDTWLDRSLAGMLPEQG
ncbi:MAG TPA: TIGR03087 family PEP-CTERM/XrtA system glycosyltransferase [Acetobacteraceae bacterium]|nr:TIGR03087 family PEP-CTERM/XrtA system glycosyltransferase [Acetobacteraceae bacterium]